MWSDIVVEVHGLRYGVPCLAGALEGPSAQKLVLYGPVDPFRDGVVLRVASFRHAYAHSVPLEKVRVREACVLQAAVGVVDEAGEVLVSVPVQGHFKRLERVAGLKAVAYAVADNLAAVAVRDKRQEAEAGVTGKGDIGYVAGYKAAGALGNQLAGQVGIERKTVARVSGGGAAPAAADLKPVLLYYVVEAVVADAVLLPEALAVHQPKLVAAYAGVEIADLADELDDEALKAQAEEPPVLVLVVGLLADTKQPADGRHAMARWVRAAKPSCHLVPAFFRSMP